MLVASLLVLTCGQILLRNLFSITLLWAEPLVRHLVLWIGFLGALIATRLDKHIRIDALLRLLPSRIQPICLAITRLFAAAIALLLAWTAIRFIADEMEFGTMAFLAVPSWIAQLVFPICFGLMALRFLYQAFEFTRQTKREEDAA